MTCKLILYPDEERFEASGAYTLVNQTGQQMDTIFLRTGFDEQTELDWQGKAQLLLENEPMKSLLFKLTPPLASNDSIKLHFTINSSPNTLFSRNSNVLENGSYLKHDMLPRVGYPFVKHELSLTDSLVNWNNYFHRDANYVNIRTTMSTPIDQIGIAPGALITEEVAGTCHYYEYQSPIPVKLNFSFHAGHFETIKEEYNGVIIELFYLKEHGLHAKMMIEGLKASLDYNTKWFGTYPYGNIRVIEFPNTEGSYTATLTANNIPTSEILFNINSKAKNQIIHLPFYVMAHELTHEWFGNQVMPADAEGAKMLTESITEYISLCIYRNQFGEKMANHFLKCTTPKV